MTNIHIVSLFLNFIIYIIMLIPIIVISLNKNFFISKKNFYFAIIISLIIEIILSAILYIFSYQIFNIMTNTTGIINFATYSSKILFITSSFYGINILIPFYIFFKNNKNSQILKFFMYKPSIILIFSKIFFTILISIFSYYLFSINGFLYSIPICDCIFYIIYGIVFFKFSKKNPL